MNHSSTPSSRIKFPVARRLGMEADLPSGKLAAESLPTDGLDMTPHTFIGGAALDSTLVADGTQETAENPVTPPSYVVTISSPPIKIDFVLGGDTAFTVTPPKSGLYF